MKRALIFLSFVFSACGSGNESDFDSNVSANNTKNFKVWGNCDMCKKTIENSLKVKGVALANWSPETQMIEVSFDSTKNNNG